MKTIARPYIVLFAFVLFNTTLYSHILAEDVTNTTTKTTTEITKKTEDNSNTAPQNNVNINIDKTENTTPENNTQLQIKIPSTLNNSQASVQNVKIDENTTAKITIKAQDITTNANEKPIEKQENKNPLGIIKNFVSDNISKDDKTTATQEQTINLNQTIDIKNPQNNQNPTITIKDGVKNININFKPEIIVCDNCDKNNTNKNDNKNTSINSQTQSDNKAKKQQKTKTKKNTKKKKQTNSVKNTTLYQQTKTLDFSNSATTPRKIYENNEISCVGNECNNLVSLSQNQPEQNIYNKPQEKIIEKETKIIEQPVYVINRIINVDEDMELSEETLNQIAMDTNSQQIAIVGNNGNSATKSFSNTASDKFKQQYDIITANNLSYGEFAFIDDYND